MTTTPKDNTPDELDEILLSLDINIRKSVEDGEMSEAERNEAKQKLRDYIAREIAIVIGRNKYPSYNINTKDTDELANMKLRASQFERAADRGWRIGS